MNITRQNAWTALSKFTFNELLAGFGFVWQQRPAVGYVINNWETDPITLWACSAKQLISLMIMYDQKEDQISVEFSWGGDWTDRIDLEATVFAVEKRFINELDIKVVKGDWLEYQEFWPSGIADKLMVRRALMSKYCRSLMEGGVSAYAGKQEGIYKAMEEYLNGQNSSNQ